MKHLENVPAAASEWLSTEELAKLTNTSASFWEKLRVYGGPLAVPYTKIGKRVRYRRSDVEAWLNARMVHSTSEGAA